MDVKIINSLDNLQPLTEQENLNKKDKYNQQEFEEWLYSKGCEFENLDKEAWYKYETFTM